MANTKEIAQQAYERARDIFAAHKSKTDMLGIDKGGREEIEKEISEAYKSVGDTKEQALFIDELRDSVLGDGLSKEGFGSIINKSILAAEKIDMNKDSKFFADALVNTFAEEGPLGDVYGQMSGLSLKEKEQAIKIAAECIPNGAHRTNFTNKCSDYMLRQYMRASIDIAKSSKSQAEINKEFSAIITNVPLDRRGEFMANLSCRMSDGHFKEESFYKISKAVEKINNTQEDHLTGVFNLGDPDGRGDAARMHIQEMATVFENSKLSDEEIARRFDAMAENMDPSFMQAEINFIEAELSDAGQKRLAAAIDNHNKAFNTCYEGRGVVCDRDEAKKFFNASWESTMEKCRAYAKTYQERAGKNKGAGKFYKALELIERVSNATKLFFNNHLMVSGRPQSLIDTIDRSYAHSNFSFAEEQEKEEAAKASEKVELNETEVDEEAKTYWKEHPNEKDEFDKDIYSVVKESVKDIATEISEAMLEGKDIEETTEKYRNVMAAISGMQGLGEKDELYNTLGGELSKNLGLDDKLETERIALLIKLDAARATSENFDRQTAGGWIKTVYERKPSEQAKDEHTESKKKEPGKTEKETLDETKDGDKTPVNDTFKLKEALRIADKVAAMAAMKKRSPEENMTAIAKWARNNKKEAEILEKHIENGGSLADKSGLEDEKMKMALQAGLDDSGRSIKDVLHELEEDAELIKNTVYAEEDQSEDDPYEDYIPYDER